MDKMEKFIDDISKVIDKSTEREKKANKEIFEAIVFLCKSLLLPFNELKEYLHNRKRL
jgi:hypothetical protein